MTAEEVNFDGLVGPTHNYAGLSFGNKAAMTHGGATSNPKAAALQGLAKMRALMKLGLPQGVLPPHERPYLPALRRIGFQGSDQHLIAEAAKTPSLLANLYSASAMWTANAATVSPSADSADGKIHFTPANLIAMPHRSLEPDTTKRILKAAFPDEDYFTVHDPLPGNDLFGDEGAANHNRMGQSHGGPGLQIFVYGRRGLDRASATTRYPGRQTLEASEAVARLHKLPEGRALCVRQSNEAIDAGAFHNDVVAVTNGPVMLMHEQAFEAPNAAMDEIRRAAEPYGFDPLFIIAPSSGMPLDDAIRSYVFNSQLVTKPDGRMALILPGDSAEIPSAKAFAEACREGDNPIDETLFFDLRESMRNGGGPACLRLRVVMTDAERARVHQPLLMTPDRLDELERWVKKHYRDRLAPEDLSDPRLVFETQTALDELTQILNLGSFYHFQCAEADAWRTGE